MRSISVAIVGLSLSLSAVAVGQDQDAPAKKTIITAETFGDAARTPDAVAAGLKTLAATRDTYRKSSAITERIKISIRTPMGTQEMNIASDYDQNGFRVVVDGEMNMVGFGDTFYMSVSPEKYLAMPVKDGNYEAALMSATGGNGVPDPIMPLRLGKDPVKPEEIPAMLSLAAISAPKLVGYLEKEGMKLVLLEGGGGSGVIGINGKNGLIERVDLTISPENAPAPMSFNIDFKIDVATPEKLADPIGFDTKGKTKVATQEELFPQPPQPIAIGQMAPEFDLKTLGGESVTLASLRGKVVVIDFWATWCGPCKRGLPVLNEVVKWAQSEKLPVEFFGVNVWEQGDAAARTKVADGYWSKQNFAFKSLIDPTDKIAEAYGVSGIPTSFVIGPDGKVAKIHQGFDPGMLESMKTELQEVVSSAG